MRGHGGGGCRGGDVEQLWLAGNHVVLPEAESDDSNQACARKTAVSPSILARTNQYIWEVEV